MFLNAVSLDLVCLSERRATPPFDYAQDKQAVLIRYCAWGAHEKPLAV
jgi:hypothetical protein